MTTVNLEYFNKDDTEVIAYKVYEEMIFDRDYKTEKGQSLTTAQRNHCIRRFEIIRSRLLERQQHVVAAMGIKK